MAPRRKASIANSKPTDYNPRDLCHPEEIEAIEAECEEDDKQVDNQDLENGGSEFSPSQDSSQETDLTSSQSTTINYALSQFNDSEDAESQWTYSQSSQSCYEEDDVGDGFAEYKPSRIFQLSTTLAAEASVNNFFIDEPLTERDSVVQNEEHVNEESWSFNSSPLEPNFPLDSNDPET